MLGFPILYFKGTRLMMFQLSGFCCNRVPTLALPASAAAPEDASTRRISVLLAWGDLGRIVLPGPQKYVE